MSKLQEILENKKIEVSERKCKVSLDLLKKDTLKINNEKRFKYAIKRKDNINIIAEIKKASPSKGIINEDIDILEAAKIYEKCGVNAISVLTDYKYFKGRLEYLKQISDIVNIPCLCKDFIIDEYQIYEAVLNNASAFLIIVKALEKNTIKDFLKTAKDLKLDVLVEIHDMDDLKKIENLDIEIIGINSRDLSDFSIDIARAVEMYKYLDKGMVKVSESGIYTRQDVLLMSDTGFDAVLVGSSIMGSKDIEEKLKELII